MFINLNVFIKQNTIVPVHYIPKKNMIVFAVWTVIFRRQG